MKLVKSLAADYWTENTNRIYQEHLHISTPVMEAYEAGFNKALELSEKLTKNNELLEIGNEDDGNGPSLYDQYMASKPENRE